jgi:hypothetical protein
VNLEQWIADAEARAEKATEGPWLSEGSCVKFDPDRDVYQLGVVSPRIYGANFADAAFIAAARTDLPAALKLLRSALAVVEEARKVSPSFGYMSLDNALAAFDAAAKEVTGE